MQIAYALELIVPALLGKNKILSLYLFIGRAI